MSYYTAMYLYTPQSGQTFDSECFSNELDALLIQDAELQHAHAEHVSRFAPRPIQHFSISTAPIETVARYWLIKSVQSQPQLLLFCIKLPLQQLLWLLRNRLIQLYKQEALRIRTAQIERWMQWGQQSLYLPHQSFSPDIVGYEAIQAHIFTALDSHESMTRLIPDLISFQYPHPVTRPVNPLDVKSVHQWITQQQHLEHRWNQISADLTQLLSPYTEQRPFYEYRIENAESWLIEQRLLVKEVESLQRTLHPFCISITLNAPYSNDSLQHYRDLLQHWTDRFAEFDRLESICQDIGWNKIWSHTERLNEETTKWRETVEQQSQFYSIYNTLQSDAHQMGRSLPPLLFPMMDEPFAQHQQKMRFYLQWWRIAHNHPCRAVESTCMAESQTSLPSRLDLLQYVQVLKSEKGSSLGTILMQFLGLYTSKPLI